MARSSKAKAEISNRSKLIEALSFVAVADTGKDVDKYAYVKIRNGFATALNDVFTIGAPVEVELDLCLHGEKLKAALEHCGPNFQLTQLDDVSVSVKSEKFRATIPAFSADTLPPGEPDDAIASINDNIKSAFTLCNPLISGKGTRLLDDCMLLRAYTAVATNGHMAFEYFHGIDLPPNLLIPKLTVTVISKMKKPLTHFGYAPNKSVTFWFEDGSFIKTKLCDGEYPDVDKLYQQFNGHPFYPLPENFFEGLDAIDKFSENDSVYFQQGYVSTHRSLQIGANYRVDGLPPGFCFNAGFWKRVKEICGQVCFLPDIKAPVCFHGTNVRGLIMGKHG